MELQELVHIWVIVCPLVFLGGVIDAVAGGGGLITLPAYLLAGLPAHIASGTNKCGNVFGTLLSTGRPARWPGPGRGPSSTSSCRSRCCTM